MRRLTYFKAEFFFFRAVVRVRCVVVLRAAVVVFLPFADAAGFRFVVFRAVPLVFRPVVVFFCWLAKLFHLLFNHSLAFSLLDSEKTAPSRVPSRRFGTQKAMLSDIH